MKTSQNRSHGSAKSSPPNPRFKNGQARAGKNEQISKYFTNKPPKEDSAISQNSQQLDSPYKKSLTEIKYMPLNDDISKDFRTPKPIKIQKKSQTKRTTLNTQKKKPKISKSKSVGNKNPLFRTTHDNFKELDVNAEHLQMALALSKSTFAVEYPELSQDAEDSSPSFLTPDEIPKGKTTLERYGFKWEKPKLLPESRREPFEASRKKNSKFRFITPTLKTRTVGERQSIAAAKISLILCNCTANNSCEDSKKPNEGYELSSDILRKFKANCSIFEVNAYNLQEDKYKYYNKNVITTPSKSKCGCLLKKWEDIPGREKSPDRLTQFKYTEIEKECDVDIPVISLTSSEDATTNSEKDQKSDSQSSCGTNSNTVSVSEKLSVEYSIDRDCISPDLFESENESECTPGSPDIVHDFSQSLLSPSKKRPRLTEPQSISRCNSLERNTSIKHKNNSDKDPGSANVKFTRALHFQNSTLQSNQGHSSKYTPQCSEDEDTEELYLTSLKTKEEIALTQNVLPKGHKEEAIEGLTGYNGANCNSKSQKAVDFIVDLTLSSSNDSTSHPARNMGDKLNAVESLRTEHCEKDLSKDVDSNFEMSPLYLKDSDELSEKHVVQSSKEDTFLHNTEGRYSETCPNRSFDFGDPSSHTSALNVTDYVNQILSQDESKNGVDQIGDVSLNNSKEDCSITSNDNFEGIRDDSGQDENEIVSSQGSCSQESIIISDEELNYSSIQSKHSGYNKNFYNLSDNEGSNDLMDVDDINSVHLALKHKYKSNDVPAPVHNRISELKSKPTLSKTNAFLEDSFNQVLDNTHTLKILESNANQEVVAGDTSSPSTGSVENLCTPEKSSQVAGKCSVNTDTTPDGNLIIKTDNITPLANYDQMETPEIVSELQKFGLKPLKRRRGVKLLKYLYENTHPFVEPGETEELSSDENDEQRIIKKRKKIGDIRDSKKLNSFKKMEEHATCDQGDIEIIGDALLKSDNLDELIFERKHSVRIFTCRIPLQIVWHNFLSKNSHIKENILLYEPIQLEVLHKMIKEQTGCKFHIQDLLTFFDRKCITIRTAQGTQKVKRKVY